MLSALDITLGQYEQEKPAEGDMSAPRSKGEGRILTLALSVHGLHVTLEIITLITS